MGWKGGTSEGKGLGFIGPASRRRPDPERLRALLRALRQTVGTRHARMGALRQTISARHATSARHS